MDIDISTKRLVSDLTLAEKQMVLIAKAVSIKCSILILDEPTAPLSHAETSKLFSMIDRLKQNGTGIVFISHRMPEIFTICDELTVMRNGTDVAAHLVKDTNPQQVIEEMLGAPLEEQFPSRRPLKDAPIVLEVKELNDQHKLNNIHFYVKKEKFSGSQDLSVLEKQNCAKPFSVPQKKDGDRAASWSNHSHHIASSSGESGNGSCAGRAEKRRDSDRRERGVELNGCKSSLIFTNIQLLKSFEGKAGSRRHRQTAWCQNAVS